MQSPEDKIGESPANELQSTLSPVQDEMVGVLLDKRYFIERKLGEGGFGDVYLASDAKVAARKVVVKVICHEAARNDWSKKKFKQELEALGRVDHPSIVGVFDGGETPEGRPYIVMQYIDGVSLRALLSPEGMPLWRVATIVRQVGNALNAAHEAGIVHRDLKPENIMVKVRDGEDHVSVIDFGVAKVKDSITGETTGADRVVGTFAYMSPEQLTAQPLTAESDIYALGVVAYEMVTGRRPTNPESPFQLLELQRSGIRLRPSDLRPGLPPPAEAAVLRALSFNPKTRFSSARDFGDFFASALLGDEELTELRRADESHLPQDNSIPETAHVLFVDIVGYSTLVMDEQARQLRRLQEVVLATSECQLAHGLGKLIRLPTGDGMALVFFHDPEAPVRCSIEVSQGLRDNPEIGLRMGVHSGFVHRLSDVNTSMNVAGGGINIAQRVMDCGDRGHILLSKRVADDLGQLARWSSHLEDLGETKVKHGVRLHLYNFHGPEFGNAAVPVKLGGGSSKRSFFTAPVLVAASLIVVALVAAGIWDMRRERVPVAVTEQPKPESKPGAGVEKTLTYWLTIQKMLNGRPLGDPIQSAGDISYGNGWRFQFNLQPAQFGSLYLLNVGPGKEGADEYNVLFPLPGVGKSSPTLATNEIFQSDWYRFVDRTGVEKMWIIWSPQPITELNEIFADAVRRSEGVIVDDSQLQKVQAYLKRYEVSKPEVVADKARKVTTVKGTQDVLVSLAELSHEAY